MSFRFYKFCQNGLITILCAAFSMFYLLSIAGSIAWWGGLLIALAATFIAFIPPLGMFHPITFAIYILIALFVSLGHSLLFFLILFMVFILHAVRFIAALTFAYKNPEKSLVYDMAIRSGVKL